MELIMKIYETAKCILLASFNFLTKVIHKLKRGSVWIFKENKKTHFDSYIEKILNGKK